ncbi:ABC transporter permease [Promicromonospora iranensis]|uniref:ABC-2 type transport system permease protein n=1 Tax=Promicromonospora iranensis TaxID=1105144 RepID=A0ABU2CQM6_9MICO|nr:ABC transporter permease [Promicromonospora iranensis]MDR7383646.1 ABC-2 type transport system permease protein [Promicromonospora iranensis]
MTAVANLGAAFSVEALKLRRSVVARVATLLLVLLVPLGSVGVVALARSPRAVGATAAKLADYATGDLATTHLLACAQILSVAALVAGGFFLAWSFGRELESGTAGALFGLAVPRGTIALAKCLVALAWIAVCVVVAVAVTVTASAVVTAGSGASFVGAWAGARTALVAGLLGGGLALPFAWLATVTRSQLGTVGGLVGMVALTQIVVLLGGGSWFPYAAPSLWTGMGGAAAAAAVGLPHLLLAAAVAPVALAAVVQTWRRLTDV